MGISAVLPLDFTWTAPDECPTQAEVVQQLSKAVDGADKELPPLTARATVRRDGASWRLELTTAMDGRRGTRLLEADSCEGLSRAATLVLALTFGEGLARRQAEAEARATPAKPPPEPTPARPSPPPPHLPERLRLQLWAGTAAGSDPLGGLGPAVVAGFALQPGLLRIGVRLEASLPRSTALIGFNGEVQSHSFSGGLQACAAPGWAAWQVSACADVGATLLRASAQGTARDRSANVPLYGAGPALGATWLLHPHAFVQLGVTSRFFFERPELVVQGLAERRRVEPFTVSGELSAGVRW